MRSTTRFMAACALCISAGTAAYAEQGAANSAQNDQGAGFGTSASHHVVLLSNCPREFREIYRGALYCRQPEQRVFTVRDARCPENVSGLYRGDLYCFGRR
ncbi:MAG: hypothetical protein AB8B62_16540 [Roseobacter sp.]